MPSKSYTYDVRIRASLDTSKVSGAGSSVTDKLNQELNKSYKESNDKREAEARGSLNKLQQIETDLYKSRTDNERKASLEQEKSNAKRLSDQEKMADQLIALAIKEQNARNKAVLDGANFEKDIARKNLQDIFNNVQQRSKFEAAAFSESSKAQEKFIKDGLSFYKQRNKQIQDGANFEKEVARNNLQAIFKGIQERSEFETAAYKKSASVQEQLIKDGLEFYKQRNKQIQDGAEFEREIARRNLQDIFKGIKERSVFESAQIAKTQAAQQKSVSFLEQLDESEKRYDSSRRGRASFSQFQIDQQNKLNASLEEGTKQTGLFSNAFKGAFAGAATGFAVGFILGNIIDLIGSLKDAAVKAVQLAGDFELTTNAMKVFSGSTRLARVELAEMDTLARNTPGLRMLDAEQGSLRLRALGFEAKTAQNLVVGLAKQKLLSGADEQAMSRVLINITQLASGSHRVTQDIKEMILAMPTMRQALIDSFGSLSNFEKELREDPKGVFRKFAEDLQSVEAPASGFNDSLGKMEDALTTAGRQFGEPILDPLTQDLKGLTQFLTENGNTWREWGQTVADALRGATETYKDWKTARDANVKNEKQTLGFSVDDLITGTLGFLFSSDARLPEMLGFGESMTDEGRRIREAEQQKKDDQFWAGFGRENPRLLSRLASNGYTLGGVSGMITDAEQAKVDKEARNRQIEEEEAAKKRELEVIQSGIDSRIARVKNGFAIEAAERDVYARTSIAQERLHQQGLSAAKLAEIDAERKILIDGYNRELELNKGDKDKTFEISVKASKALSDLDREAAVERFAQKKRDADLERQLADQLRQDLVAAKQLEVRELQNLNTRAAFDTERRIALTGEGFDELIRLTESFLERQKQITIDSYALQLQDEKLTNQQRLNLTKQLNVELAALEEQSREQIQAIQDRKYQEQIARLDRYSQAMSSRYGVSASLYDTVGSALGTQLIDSKFVKNLENAFFGEGTLEKRALMRSEISGLDAKASSGFSLADSLYAQLQAYADNGDQSDPKKFRENMDRMYDAYKLVFDSARDFKDQAEATRGDLDKLDASVVKNRESIYEVAKAYSEGAAGIKEFQAAQLKLFDDQTTLKAADYSQKIATLRDELSLASKDGRTAPKVIAKYTTDLNNLIGEQTTFLFDQANKRAEIYNKSIAGMEDMLNKLRTADPALTRTLGDSFRGEDLADKIKLYQDLYRLQYEIDHPDDESEVLQVQNALLQQQLDIRKESLDAVIEAKTAEVEINRMLEVRADVIYAKVMRHLADQKGMTDAIADGINGMYDSAAGFFDRMIDRSNAKLGAFGGFIGGIEKTLTHSFLTKITTGLLGAFGLGGHVNTDDANPVVAGLKKQDRQIDLLEQIVKNTGGGPGLPAPSIVGGFNPGFRVGGGGGFNPLQAFSRFLTGGFAGGTSPGASAVGGGGAYDGLLSAIGGLGSAVGSAPASTLPGRSGGFLGMLGGLFGKGGPLSFGALKGNFASFLPGLGLSLGAGLGSGSMLGTILGGVGGLALGGAGAVGLLGGAGAAIFGTGGALASLAPLAALLTNPFTIAAAGALIPLAIILGINARRKAAEKQRSVLRDNAGAELDKLISQVRSRHMTGTDALAQAETIRQQYTDEVAKLKDSKTRRIAMNEWNEPNILWRKMHDLQKEAGISEAADDREKRILPEFATGGWVRAQRGGTLARIGEGGYDEVVLSTDPSKAQYTSQLLSGFLANYAPAQSAAAPTASPATGATFYITTEIDANGMVKTAIQSDEVQREQIKVINRLIKNGEITTN